jgi:hypothetical protein
MGTPAVAISDQDVAALNSAANVETDAEAAALISYNNLFSLYKTAISNATSLSASDRAALNAVTAKLTANAATLAAAVVANTPAA